MTNVILALSLILLLFPTVFSQNKTTHISKIEFFGTNGQSVDEIRKSLPYREGDETSIDAIPETSALLKGAIKRATGSEPTEVATVCCDDGGLLIYIGLNRGVVPQFKYNPEPHGASRLPEKISELYQQIMDLTLVAIQQEGGKEKSNGFSLSTYPPLRAKQLALREYVLSSEPLVRHVLRVSADATQRAAAATALGYARQSKDQMAALIHASHDANDNVRNNAVRALAVLAASSAKSASQISPTDFVDMLNSGTWTDRNKGAFLLEILSATRDVRLLGELRRRALQSLIEMARWRNPGHANNPRTILGRVAGIEENRLAQLVAAGNAEEILQQVKKL
ncbi:MAG TPA: hypothetical protein VIV66_13415 [Pyrinomonadaceae bacterium]